MSSAKRKRRAASSRGGIRGSFGLDAGGLDDALPAAAVFHEPAAEMLGRAAAPGNGAEGPKFLARFGLGKRSAHRLVQPADDRARRAGGGHHAQALRVLLEAREAAFRHGGRVGIVGMAPLRAGSEHLEPL